MKPITYFKVKLWKSIPDVVCGNLIKKYRRNENDYYRVIIFNSFEDMYEYADKYFGEKVEHNYSAICKYSSHTYFEDDKFIDIDKCCGWILLNRNYMGSGTVSHECTHAITFYFEYRITNCKKVFGTQEYNELFAYMVGSIVNQIYNKMYSRKLL